MSWLKIYWVKVGESYDGIFRNHVFVYDYVRTTLYGRKSVRGIAVLVLLGQDASDRLFY